MNNNIVRGRGWYFELEEKLMNTYAEINLPYYKQGDDLYGCINYCKEAGLSLYEAFAEHSDLMVQTSEILINIHKTIREFPKSIRRKLIINAGGQHISVSGSPEIIKALVDKQLAIAVIPKVDIGTSEK